MYKMSKQYDLALKKASLKKPDLALVFRLLEEAQELGDRRADYALATWYLNGVFVNKNISKGTKFLKQAAKACIPDALHDLGVNYTNGVGVSKSEKMAFRSYLEGALYGDPQSIVEVCRCYYYGLGVDKDRKLAAIWYRKAEAEGIEVE